MGEGRWRVRDGRIGRERGGREGGVGKNTTAIVPKDIP